MAWVVHGSHTHTHTHHWYPNRFPVWGQWDIFITDNGATANGDRKHELSCTHVSRCCLSLMFLDWLVGHVLVLCDHRVLTGNSYLSSTIPSEIGRLTQFTVMWERHTHIHVSLICGLLIGFCLLLLVYCGLWIVDCGLFIVDCGLWIVNCELWIVDFLLLLVDCWL